jgi:hypothetical protein
MGATRRQKRKGGPLGRRNPTAPAWAWGPIAGVQGHREPTTAGAGGPTTGVHGTEAAEVDGASLTLQRCLGSRHDRRDRRCRVLGCAGRQRAAIALLLQCTPHGSELCRRWLPIHVVRRPQRCLQLSCACNQACRSRTHNRRHCCPSPGIECRKGGERPKVSRGCY